MSFKAEECVRTASSLTIKDRDIEFKFNEPNDPFLLIDVNDDIEFEFRVGSKRCAIANKAKYNEDRRGFSKQQTDIGSEKYEEKVEREADKAWPFIESTKRSLARMSFSNSAFKHTRDGDRKSQWIGGQYSAESERVIAEYITNNYVVLSIQMGKSGPCCRLAIKGFGLECIVFSVDDQSGIRVFHVGPGAGVNF